MVYCKHLNLRNPTLKMKVSTDYLALLQNQSIVAVMSIVSTWLVFQL